MAMEGAADFATDETLQVATIGADVGADDSATDGSADFAVEGCFDFTTEGSLEVVAVRKEDPMTEGTSGYC